MHSLVITVFIFFCTLILVPPAMADCRSDWDEAMQLTNEAQKSFELKEREQSVSSFELALILWQKASFNCSGDEAESARENTAIARNRICVSLSLFAIEVAEKGEQTFSSGDLTGSLTAYENQERLLTQSLIYCDGEDVDKMGSNLLTARKNIKAVKEKLLDGSENLNADKNNLLKSNCSDYLYQNKDEEKMLQWCNDFNEAEKSSLSMAFLGEALMMNEKYEEAVGEYIKSLEKNKEDGKINSVSLLKKTCGIFLYKLGNGEKAIEWCEEYNKAADSSLSLSSLGSALMLNGKYEEAVGEYIKSFEKNREDGKNSSVSLLKKTCGIFLYKLGNGEKAVEWCEEYNKAADSSLSRSALDNASALK